MKGSFFLGFFKVEASTISTMKEQIENEYGKGGLIDKGYNSIQERVRNTW